MGYSHVTREHSWATHEPSLGRAVCKLFIHEHRAHTQATCELLLSTHEVSMSMHELIALPWAHSWATCGHPWAVHKLLRMWATHQHSWANMSSHELLICYSWACMRLPMNTHELLVCYSWHVHGMCYSWALMRCSWAIMIMSYLWVTVCYSSVRMSYSCSWVTHELLMSYLCISYSWAGGELLVSYSWAVHELLSCSQSTHEQLMRHVMTYSCPGATQEPPS